MSQSMGEIEKKVKYPIGEQSFSSLRRMGCLYVDKTAFIRKIVEGGSKYVFLARPRRFGKSLFLSTLKSFWKGERDLFEGLEIDSMDWDWAPYPVLHLDFNRERYAEPGLLEAALNDLFKEWERAYDIREVSDNLPARFRNIIKGAHDKTGRQVVILVDEYDKALVGNLHKKETFEHYRESLAAIYTNFKGAADHIRLVFITGVSRFGRLSVFSDLNNLDDVTFQNDYADICGITEKELHENFKIGIGKLAQAWGWDYDKACRELKDSYDGYRFAAGGSDIYNPWSVLNAMSVSKIGNYWNETGFPSLLIESLKKLNANLEKIFNGYCSEDDLKGLDLLSPDPRALLYQTGYLTIKGYNSRINKVRLGIPNKEVKIGLFNNMLPYYVDTTASTPGKVVRNIVRGFKRGNPEEAMLAMQTYFAGVSYKLRMDNENNFHNAFFLLVDLLGLNTEAEAHTSDGSIDILIKTEDYIYIIELKYDHTAQQAIDQIERKRYVRPYLTDSREVICIGASFSSETRCIEDWIIKREQ